MNLRTTSHNIFLNFSYCILSAIFLSLFLITPVFAATTYHYNCTDFKFDSGGGCVSSVGVITSGVEMYDEGPAIFPLSVGTWYFSWTNTGGDVRLTCVSSFCSDTSYAGNQVDVAMGISSNTGLSGVDFIGNFGVASELSNICVSDTLGACAGGGGGGGASGTTTIATTTQETIALNNINFGLACIFFLLCLFFFAYFTPGYTDK